MIEVLEIIRILIALIGTGVASYYDIFNKKNVPEIMLYAFLGLSLFINIFDYTLFLKYLPMMILLLIFLYILYRNGQIGGADLIVVAAIYAALPVFPMNDEQMIPSSLMILAVATILASIWIIIKYTPKILKIIKKGELKINIWQALQIVMLLISFILLVYMFTMFPFLPIWILIVALILFIETIFFTISKDFLIEEMIVMKKKIEPEDVIAIEKIDKKLIEKYNIKRLTDERQAEILNRIGKKWPVMDMPMFLPFIFIGLILYLFFGFILY